MSSKVEQSKPEMSKAEQLKVLKAKRAAAEAEEKNRQLLESDNEKIEAELREEAIALRDLEDKKALREAHLKYGLNRVADIVTPEGMLIVRGGTAEEWEEFRKSLGAANGEAEERVVNIQFIRDMIVYPDEKRADEILAAMPNVLKRAEQVMIAIAAGRDVQLAKKA